MREEAAFSAVIPVFNGENHLEASLACVLGLGYPSMEVVVVDDASSDSTPRIAARFADRLRYVRRERNGGPAAARNLGMETARGDIIAFLDADDLWCATTLVDAIRILTAQPQLDIVFEVDLLAAS